MAWGIFTGERKGKKKVVGKLFPKRNEAVITIKELKKAGLDLPLYTKRTKKK